MKRRGLTLLAAALTIAAGMLYFAPKAESAVSRGTSSTVSMSVPRSITYKREFHRSTGFPHTKYYRHTRYGRSYAGHLTFQYMSGEHYAVYRGTLYLEGGNYPVPSKYQPLK